MSVMYNYPFSPSHLALEWDPSGIDFEGANENTSDDTAGPTISADHRYRPHSSSHYDDRDRSISEAESLLDTDFAEDDISGSGAGGGGGGGGGGYEPVQLQPPQLFQDMLLAKPELVDHYRTHEAFNKRFSDYIPASLVEPDADGDECDGTGERATTNNGVPQPMPALDGYTSFAAKKKRRDESPARRVVSEEILSSFGDGDLEEDGEPETTSLLNGHGKRVAATDFNKRHAWASDAVGGDREIRPFSTLLGKQTQV